MTQIAYITLFLADRFVFSDLLLVAGVALVTTSLLMIYRKRRRRAAQRPTPHEQIEQMRQRRGVRGDLEDLMVEIEQLAKRMGAQLDAKSIQLEQVLREADQRIEQLSGLCREKQAHDAFEDSHRSGLAPAGGVGSDPPTGAVSTGGDPSEKAMVKAVYALADQGLTPADIANRLGELVGKVELILALRGS